MNTNILDHQGYKISSMLYKDKLFIYKIRYISTINKAVNKSNQYFNLVYDEQEKIIKIICNSWYKSNLAAFDKILYHKLELLYQSINSDNYLTGGNKIVLFNQQWTINFVNNQSLPNNDKYIIDEIDKVVNIYTKYFKYQTNKQLINDWKKIFAKQYLNKRITTLLAQTNKTTMVSKISFFTKKYVYGACYRLADNKYELAFNINSIVVPQEAIDALIYHEITHTDFFNHSKKFYDKVELYCPNYRTKIEKLNYNQIWKTNNFCL